MILILKLYTIVFESLIFALKLLISIFTLADFTLQTINKFLNVFGVVLKILDVLKLLLFKLSVSSLKQLNLLISILKLFIKNF